MPSFIPLEVRYERHIERTATCWLWNGTRNQAGYGQFRVGRKGPVISVHRWAYERAYGPIPEGLLVLHTCDTPRCSNPDHLYAGTPTQNAQDAISRSRRAKTHRFAPRTKKLTDDQVRAIRADDRRTWEIAAQYGVSETTISFIQSRKRKASVPDIWPLGR